MRALLGNIQTSTIEKGIGYYNIPEESSALQNQKLYVLPKMLCAANIQYKNVEQNDQVEISSHQKQFIARFITIIAENIDIIDLTVENIALKMCMGRVQLYRKLKAVINESPSQFIQKIKLKRARNLIINTGLPLKEIAYRAGFSSPSHFSRAFKKAYGKPPSMVKEEAKYS